MKREAKSSRGRAEKEENLGEKLKRGVLVGKKAGPCTPLLSWTLFPSSSAHDCSIPNHHAASVSARKLAAVLWEFHHYNLPLAKMHRPVHDAPGPSADSKLTRRRHQHRHQLLKDKSLHLSHFLADPCPSSSDQVDICPSIYIYARLSITALLKFFNYSVVTILQLGYLVFSFLFVVVVVDLEDHVLMSGLCLWD